MPSCTPQVAAVAAVAAGLALSAGPALARATTSSGTTLTAKTPQTAESAKPTTLNDGIHADLGRNAVTRSDARNLVDRVRSNSAQQPAKREWVLGADIQRRADNPIAHGQLELVDHHTSSGKAQISIPDTIEQTGRSLAARGLVAH